MSSTSRISTAGAPPPSTNIGEVIEVAGRQFNERKSQAPSIPDNHKNLQIVLAFVLALFESIYLMVTTITVNLSRRISMVEDGQETIEELTAQASAASAAPPSIHPRSTRSAHAKRCQQCHARGHNSDECRTANPSAMRRRVASNSRIAKEARANVALPTIPASAPMYAPWQSPFIPSPAAPVPVNYANLVADATELRRRAAQSSRDRRINRRRQSSTTS